MRKKSPDLQRPGQPTHALRSSIDIPDFWAVAALVNVASRCEASASMPAKPSRPRRSIAITHAARSNRMPTTLLGSEARAVAASNRCGATIPLITGPAVPFRTRFRTTCARAALWALLHERTYVTDIADPTVVAGLSAAWRSRRRARPMALRPGLATGLPLSESQHTG